MNDNVLKAIRFFGPKIENPFGISALVGGLCFATECNNIFGVMANSKGGNIDESTREDFGLNRIEFGIVGWREWTRKWSLYNFCKKRGTSLCDLDSQLEFVMDEFGGITFEPVIKGLRNAKSIPDTAYLVYDKYLDIPKAERTEEMRDKCAKRAMDIYKEYFHSDELHVPVKYVKTDKKNVRVKAYKKTKFPFIRKTLGYLKPNELYRFISLSEYEEEYIIYFNDSIGCVNENKINIVTRMEVL